MNTADRTRRNVYRTDAIAHAATLSRERLLAVLAGDHNFDKTNTRQLAAVLVACRVALVGRFPCADCGAARGTECKPEYGCYDESRKPSPDEQACRDCGKLFPYDPDADRCPACVARHGMTDEQRPNYAVALLDDMPERGYRIEYIHAEDDRGAIRVAARTWPASVVLAYRALPTVEAGS